jgi:hypothetical protein
MFMARDFRKKGASTDHDRDAVLNEAFNQVIHFSIVL